MMKEKFTVEVRITMKRKIPLILGWVFALAFFTISGTLLAPPAWAGVGSGTLTVSDDGLCSGTGFSDFDSPNHWDVFQGQIIHINISPGFSICTAGAAYQQQV